MAQVKKDTHRRNLKNGIRVLTQMSMRFSMLGR